MDAFFSSFGLFLLEDYLVANGLTLSFWSIDTSLAVDTFIGSIDTLLAVDTFIWSIDSVGS